MLRYRHPKHNTSGFLKGLWSASENLSDSCRKSAHQQFELKILRHPKHTKFGVWSYIHIYVHVCTWEKKICIYVKKSSLYICKRALCILKRAVYIYANQMIIQNIPRSASRAKKNSTHLSKRALQIYQKYPVYKCKKSVYKHGKEPCIYMQKSPTYIGLFIITL